MTEQTNSDLIADTRLLLTVGLLQDARARAALLCDRLEQAEAERDAARQEVAEALDFLAVEDEGSIPAAIEARSEEYSALLAEVRELRTENRWLREELATARSDGSHPAPTAESVTVVTASDGLPSIVVNDRQDCICPPGLVGTDLACRVHGIARGAS